MKGELTLAKVLNQSLKPILSQTRFLDCKYEKPYSFEPTASSSKFSTNAYTRNTAWHARIVFSPLEHLLTGIGETFPNLESLTILGESVKLIQRQDFANMKQLTALDLYGLSIEFLSVDLLTDLPNLTEIKMKSCKLDKIPEKLFENQRDLKTLDLDDNRIEVLEKDLFKFNLKLKWVYVDKNNLKQIFVDFSKLTAITRINFVGSDHCMSRVYRTSRGDQMDVWQNAVTSCCGASEKPADNCTCFPRSKQCLAAAA